jgi:ankyrin repeat protein
MNNSKIRIFLLTTLLIINPCISQASENKMYDALTNALAQNNPDKALLQELLCGAIESNDQKTIELFFKCPDRFDIDKPCTRGVTPLMMACCVKNIELIKRLIKYGADVNAVGIKNRSSLICAINLKNLKIIELLIQHGATVNMCDADGDTPLIYAVNHNDSDVIRTLINHGADLDAVDQIGFTALMHAACLGNHSIVELLIEKGADSSVQAKPRVNALSMALHSQTANRQTIKKIVRTILAQNHAAVIQQAYEKLEYNSRLKKPADISILQDAFQELGLAIPPIKIEPNTSSTELVGAAAGAAAVAVGVGAFYSGVMLGALGGTLAGYLMARH